jgi:hypothetical protein
MNDRFLLKNGEVVHHDRIGREDVLVSGERIEKVAAEQLCMSARIFTLNPAHPIVKRSTNKRIPTKVQA